MAAPGYLDFLATEHRAALMGLACIVAMLGIFSLIAWRAPQRQRKDFTFDLRQKARLYWSLTAVALSVLALDQGGGGALVWLFGFCLVEAGDRTGVLGRFDFSGKPASAGWRLAGRWAPVLLVAIAACILLAISYRDYRVWAPLRVQAQREQAERVRLAAGGGFPLRADRAVAKIMLADPWVGRHPAWSIWSSARAPDQRQSCRDLDVGGRVWVVCADAGDQTGLVAVVAQPLANADQRAALRDAMKLMMWVVDRDSPEAVQAAVLARLDAVRAAEADIPYGDVTLHVSTARDFHYIIQAPAPGQPIADSAATRFW